MTQSNQLYAWLKLQECLAASRSRTDRAKVVGQNLLFLAVACLVLQTGCEKSGQPAGDYAVIPIESHLEVVTTSTGKTRSSTRCVPTNGQHFVVAYKTQQTKTRFKKAKQLGDDFIRNSRVAWSGDSALARFSTSKAPGRSTFGDLFVGPIGEGNHEILWFTSEDNVVPIAKAIQGRALIVPSNVPDTLLHSKQADDPAVIQVLKEISDGTISLWTLKILKNASGDKVLSTVLADPKTTVSLRCKCAFAVWALSGGTEGEPLAKVMMDPNREIMSGKGRWNIFELETLSYLDGGCSLGKKVGEFINLSGPETEDRIEAEAQAIENIFKFLPEGEKELFQLPKFSDHNHLWVRLGVPMRFSYRRATSAAGRSYPTVNNPRPDALTARLLKSEVKVLRDLVKRVCDDLAN